MSLTFDVKENLFLVGSKNYHSIRHQLIAVQYADCGSFSLVQNCLCLVLFVNDLKYTMPHHSFQYPDLHECVKDDHDCNSIFRCV